ncbi:MAG: hypothetical protein Kilf2KO_07390 [Rhodospirillales bacterium]
MTKLPFIDRCSRFIGESMAYVYLASVAIIGFEVVARYFFGAPTIWAHESVIALSALGFIFGGVYALQRGAHVRIFVVVQLLPKRWQRRIEIFNQFVICAYLLVFIYACWILAERAIMQWETSASAWNQPTPVLIKTALVVGGVAILIQALAFLVRLLRGESVPTSDAGAD